MRPQASDDSGHSLSNCKVCKQCGSSKPVQAYISKNKAFICLICDTCRMNQRKKSRENSRIRKMKRAIKNVDYREVNDDGWIYRPISAADGYNPFSKPGLELGSISPLIDSVIPTARWIPSTLNVVDLGQSAPVVATAVSHYSLQNRSRY